MIKAVPTLQYFWEYIDWHGNYSEGEYATAEAAENACNEKWAQACEDDGGKSGDLASEDIDLIRFYYRDDDGARIEVERIKGGVLHEFYHGDGKEHG